jgi:hypothetical protein
MKTIVTRTIRKIELKSRLGRDDAARSVRSGTHQKDPDPDSNGHVKKQQG